MQTLQPTKTYYPEHIEPGTEAIWDALHDVADPEFPVSIVDMGLVYGATKNGSDVTVDLTFTSMGCPCMDMILYDIQTRLKKVPGVESVHIEIVWNPPWTHEKLSSHAVEQLSVWGVSI